jgi:hypothetical protein
MPPALALLPVVRDQVEDYLTALTQLSKGSGRTTVKAARSFAAKLQRAGGWDRLALDQQIEAIVKARAFASWLMVTGQLTVSADILGRLDLRLGNAAGNHCREAHRWFLGACALLNVRDGDMALQWNTLAKVTALTGVAPDRVGTAEFEYTRRTIIDAYLARGLPSSGRNIASIFHRLQLTLFHAGRLDTATRATQRAPVSVTGWAATASAIAEVSQRYVAQITLSLRPSTVTHIEHDLREFATWLAQQHPEVTTCADLQRLHIEQYKAWLATKSARYTGKPLNRLSIKNRLINLHCFFNRIWAATDLPDTEPTRVVLEERLSICPQSVGRSLRSTRNKSPR